MPLSETNEFLRINSRLLAVVVLHNKVESVARRRHFSTTVFRNVFATFTLPIQDFSELIDISIIV